MATDKYLHVHYFETAREFAAAMEERGRAVVVVDNIHDSVPLSSTDLPKNAVLVFGQEGPGVSPELTEVAKKVVAIEQFGSTRSINVGVAAGIAMYAWAQQYVLKNI